jgi:hypothetical protein
MYTHIMQARTVKHHRVGTATANLVERLIEVLPEALGERFLGRCRLGAAQRSLAVLDDGI